MADKIFKGGDGRWYGPHGIVATTKFAALDMLRKVPKKAR
jgi:hypothetical protein